jgi:hypothetical protein
MYQTNAFFYPIYTQYSLELSTDLGIKAGSIKIPDKFIILQIVEWGSELQSDMSLYWKLYQNFSIW